MRYDTFRQEVKLYFTLFYESRIKGFVFKTYFDERIFKNFKDKRSNFLGLLKILFFFHVFIFFVDIIFALFYFIEFLINIFFRYIFFSIGQFFYMISCLLKFLAYEKRKYIDYEKLEKTINIILRIKKKYKKKNKYYIMLSDYIDPNEKKIKSFLRKKKLDIKTNNFSTFFLDLANTFHTDIQAYMLETIIVRRKSNKRWRSYLYLFFISTFFYSFRLFVASMKNLYQKNFYYEAIFEFLKQSVPTKLKKNF
jgi:hypothetical protein